ncbi:peroxisomal adenine nucleotide transporter 1 [Didymella exigua CBS 183.55]|uniref:Peroxisomal adenine nucleotide transporter 1 n=1 Tax=Didymella exigua CBS 183.55 TaxID=1150837 RepID=A0A6A5RDN9_9PLEO|nr:peroxisomal adenine nucleotide transporter 1 [Didymella exigua CBS 183.55]KAF1925792.1 peroxisomal adenine nucleotide transporter 1 [Didymella exigua CBS 183.55]
MSSYTYIYNSQLDAFSLYHLTHEQATKPSALGPALPALGHATSGALGTAISKLITYPLDLVVARLQVQKQLQGENEKPRYDGILDAIEKIYEREGGISAFYNGVPHEVFKGVTDSFLFFLAYSYVRQNRLAAQGGRKSLGALEEIGVGVVAGAFSKLCTTPIQNIVTRKQTAAMTALDGSTGIPPASSARDIAYEIRKEKGLQGFWSGYSASLILTLNPSLTMLLHKVLLRLLVPHGKRDDPGARITFLIAATSKALASTLTYPFQLAKTRAQVSSQKPSDASGETSEFEKTEKPLRSKAVRARQRTVFATILRIAQTEGFQGLYQGLGGEVLKGFFSHGITMLMKERIHAAIISLYYSVLKSMERFPNAEQLKEMAAEGIEDGKGRVSDAYTKGVEVAGQAAEKVQEAVAQGSQQAQDLYASSKEQISEAYGRATDTVSSGSQQAQSLAEGAKEQARGAYNNAAEAAQSVSSTAEAQASKIGDAAQSASLTAQDPASGSYAKATDVTEPVALTAQGKASEVYNKYAQAADSPTASAQQAVSTESQSVSLVEKGKEIANNAQEQSRDIADSYGKKE